MKERPWITAFQAYVLQAVELEPGLTSRGLAASMYGAREVSMSGPVFLALSLLELRGMVYSVKRPGWPLVGWKATGVTPRYVRPWCDAALAWEGCKPWRGESSWAEWMMETFGEGGGERCTESDLERLFASWEGGQRGRNESRGVG